MALRLKHKVVVQISRDTDQKQKGVVFLDDDSVQEVDTSGYLRSAGGDISIAVSSTEALNLGDVQAVRGLYLEVDGQCNVTLNGANVALDVQPDAGTTGKRGKLLLNAGITSVSVENVSATTVLTGFYAVWGDVAP